MTNPNVDPDELSNVAVTEKNIRIPAPKAKAPGSDVAGFNRRIEDIMEGFPDYNFRKPNKFDVVTTPKVGKSNSLLPLSISLSLQSHIAGFNRRIEDIMEGFPDYNFRKPNKFGTVTEPVDLNVNNEPEKTEFDTEPDEPYVGKPNFLFSLSISLFLTVTF
ncbi:unnamed protein product [Acanthosepion pharaonis]|uniref:Uncharacterized protein n=1 Tax=Acanthosepion pharaonis TaxID=158019 RepID=A0A812EC63_ACAPH|nr:unnamed protein product [Sepia pharaonis]